METETFENSLKSGDIWKRIVLKTLRFQCGQVKTETFENDDVKASDAIECKSEHLSKMEDG